MMQVMVILLPMARSLVTITAMVTVTALEILHPLARTTLWPFCAIYVVRGASC